MKIAFFILLTCLLFRIPAAAQKTDTVVYYLTTANKIVDSKDSALYFVVILPPDTTVNKDLYVVKEFYANGNLKFVTNSTSNQSKAVIRDVFYLPFQGPYISFFINKHKMRIGNYEDGRQIGDQLDYFPNGKLSTIKSIEDGKTLYKECRDSTGNVLMENGNGKWASYDFENDTFETGAIVNGLHEGRWDGRINDSTGTIAYYKNGLVEAMATVDKLGNEVYTLAETPASFKGDVGGFTRYIVSSLQYPARARRNGTSGRVIASFIVDKGGHIANVKIIRGLGDDCNQEVVRVLTESPKWKPAMQNGKPVSTVYTIPISFSLK